MATITPVPASAAGALQTFVAASGGGDSIAVGTSAGRKVIFHVRNASGSSVTVTLAGSVACSLGQTHNVAVVCAVGDTEIVVPAHTVNATTGATAVTYSSATSVTVAASAPNG